jgi:hypothetical protein
VAKQIQAALAAAERADNRRVHVPGSDG